MQIIVLCTNYFSDFLAQEQSEAVASTVAVGINQRHMVRLRRPEAPMFSTGGAIFNRLMDPGNPALGRAQGLEAPERQIWILPKDSVIHNEHGV